MYNLIEHSSNYSETIESLWFYLKDEASKFNNTNNANTTNFRSFKYKTKLLGNTVAQAENVASRILINATISVPLKYLSNFLKFKSTENAIN